MADYVHACPALSRNVFWISRAQDLSTVYLRFGFTSILPHPGKWGRNPVEAGVWRICRRRALPMAAGLLFASEAGWSSLSASA